MRDTDHWQAANDQYLSEALAWLRQRLEQFASAGTPHPGFFKRLLPAPPLAVPVKRPAPGPHGEPAPALIDLARRLGLSDFERDVLLLCVAIELDTGIGPLCARAQGNPGMSYPTFSLAFTLFDQPAWDALSPQRPLRYWHLVELAQSDGQALVSSPLRVDQRIVAAAKGMHSIDERLAHLAWPLNPAAPAQALPASQALAAARLETAMRAANARGATPVVELLGLDSASKRAVALQLAGVRCVRMVRMAVAALPAEMDLLARLWQRETLLQPVGLYLEAGDVDAGDARIKPAQQLLERAGALVFLDARDIWPGLERGVLIGDIAKPTPSEQRAAWQLLLGDRAQLQPARLAGQFDLNLAAIEGIAASALTEAAQQLPGALWEGCLMHARPALDRLAQRLAPKADWAGLQLPPQELALLRQIAAQVGARSAVYDDFGFRERMNRGLGISVLFAGESGTGKTMAAEVIAAELGLLLYRIDLSAVVSKYIGETEKNLRALFDAAESGGAILFFDEADALFGKRSEVRDSHDRYANIEVNYLLQRIESFQGLAILATNMKSALDAAFMRRLRFVVNFPFPRAELRKAIWMQAFPEATPRAALDYQRLARLNLSGASIHSIVLNSAFVAAERGLPVTMALLLEAARAEFRKLDKPVSEAELRWIEATKEPS